MSTCAGSLIWGRCGDPVAPEGRFGTDLGRGRHQKPAFGTDLGGLQLRRKDDLGPIWGVRLRSAGDKVIPGARAEGKKCPGANPPSFLVVFFASLPNLVPPAPPPPPGGSDQPHHGRGLGRETTSHADDTLKGVGGFLVPCAASK